MYCFYYAPLLSQRPRFVETTSRGQRLAVIELPIYLAASSLAVVSSFYVKGVADLGL